MGNPINNFFLPIPRNNCFVGRESILERLRTNLRGSIVGSRKAQAITGIGGIGKTQISLEYAYTEAKNYKHIMFIDATDLLTISLGFAKAALNLGLVRDDSPTKQSDNLSKRWLSLNTDWLLIFDNADTQESLKYINNEFISKFHNGHYIITTRCSNFDYCGQGEQLEVDVLQEQEAVRFVLARTANKSQSITESTSALALVNELGRLPLALEQACAYIVSTQCSITNYLNTFKSKRLSLLNRSRPTAGNYPETIATTWSINLSAVRIASPAAAEVLLVSSLTHNESIPCELFPKGATHLGKEIHGFLKDFYISLDYTMMDRLLEPLIEFSLVSKQSELLTFSTHRMLQEVVKSRMNKRSLSIRVKRLIAALSDSFPIVEYDQWALCSRLLPHVLNLLIVPIEDAFESEQGGRLLHRTAHYLEEIGRYDASIKIYHRVLSIRKKVLGTTHGDYGTTLNNLGVTYYKLGRFDLAAKFYTEALEARLSAWGENHPDVAQSLMNLGVSQLDLGELQLAEDSQTRAMRILTLCGDEQKGQLSVALNNLAGIKELRGEMSEAAKLLEQALEIQIDLFGIGHPTVAGTKRNLAIMTGKSGDWLSAQSIINESLASMRKSIGLRHPEYARTLGCFGFILTNLKKFDEAAPIFLKSIHLISTSVDPDHPSLCSNRINYGYCLAELGHRNEAIEQLELALEIQVAGMKRDSIETATLQSNLGVLLLQQGSFQRAKHLLLNAVSTRSKILGTWHEDVLSVMSNLALIAELGEGEVEEASRLYSKIFNQYRTRKSNYSKDFTIFFQNFMSFLIRNHRFKELREVYEELKLRKPWVLYTSGILPAKVVSFILNLTNHREQKNRKKGDNLISAVVPGRVESNR